MMFFTMMLMDQLRRRRRGIEGHLMSDQGASSVAYSLAVLPTDYGVLCLAMGLLAWQPGFLIVYSALALANVVFAAAALPKWYLEIRRPASAPA